MLFISSKAWIDDLGHGSKDGHPKKHAQSTANGCHDGVEVVDVVLFVDDNHVGAEGEVGYPGVRVVFTLHLLEKSHKIQMTLENLYKCIQDFQA